MFCRISPYYRIGFDIFDYVTICSYDSTISDCNA